MIDRYICKAKRTDNGEWVEGFYFCMVHDDGRHVHHFIMPLGADLSLGTPIENIQIEVVPETVCQCAGLNDKNGKRIWENDILKYTWNGVERIDVIKYQAPIFTYSNSFRWSLDKDEVIGNIFDNPELLEGGAE